VAGVAREPGSTIQSQWHRRRAVRALAGVSVVVASVAALFLVAPLGRVSALIAHMSPAWLLLAIGLECLSCVGYVVVFRHFFSESPRKITRRVAWISMAAGAVLPGGNFSSAATSGWLLRNEATSHRRLAERCGSLLCFLTLFGFLVNGVAGALLLAGVGGGPHDLAHAGIPILVSVFVLGTATVARLVCRREGAGTPRIVRSLGAALEHAWRVVLDPHPRLLGAAAFLWFDMAALWAACRATGHPIPALALAVAYFIGYLATMIPVPAGLGVLDSGLVGALVLYGFSPAAAVAAVLVYHAISIWIPGLGGLVAWLPTRTLRFTHRRPAIAR
jgi:uncharacterized membrane protein YbhN (UPF0104 family)